MGVEVNHTNEPVQALYVDGIESAFIQAHLTKLKIAHQGAAPEVSIVELYVVADAPIADGEHDLDVLTSFGRYQFRGKRVVSGSTAVVAGQVKPTSILQPI